MSDERNVAMMDAAAPIAPAVVILVASQLLFARALSDVLSGDSTIYVRSILRSIDDLEVNAPQAIDLVLVDVDEYSDIAAAFSTCRKRAPRARLCALSSFARPELMRRCLASGADGFIMKDTYVSELIPAIKLLARGTPYVDAGVTDSATSWTLAHCNIGGNRA